MNNITKVILLVLCLLPVVWLSYALHGFPKIGIDDANIFFTYAENLASGNGISYAHNAERVEGFTSMLWMLICALIFFIGQKEIGVLVVSICIMLFTQWILINVICRFAVQKGKKAWPYVCGYLVLIACSPAYITWMTISLMDTCLWGLFIASMTFFVIFPPKSNLEKFIAAIPFIFAPMSRPEGMLVAPLLIALLWIRSYSLGLNYITRYCIKLFYLMFFLLGLLTAFRLMYFGYPFPNTYYAKVSPSIIYNLWEGMKYLTSFIISGSIIVVFVAIVLFIFRSVLVDVFYCFRDKKSDMFLRPYDASALVALLLLFIPVVSGGDHFRMFRLYQPVYPIICLTVVLWMYDLRIEHLSSANRAIPHIIQYFFLVVFVPVIGYGFYSVAFRHSWDDVQCYGSTMKHEFSISENGIKQGNTLVKIFVENNYLPSIGVITSGGIARTYPGPIVDLMGLNNSLIAHFKGDRKGIKNHAAFEKDTFFMLDIDLLLFAPTGWGSKQLKGLCEDPRFTGEWLYGEFSLKNNPKYSIKALARSSFLSKIKNNPNLEYRVEMIWLGKLKKWVKVVPSAQQKK
jgi:hypothetical protein